MLPYFQDQFQHLYIFLTAIEKENNRIATWYSKNSLGIRNGQINAKIKYILDEEIKVIQNKKIELEDKVYRAYGSLMYAKKLSYLECAKLISIVRLGIS